MTIVDATGVVNFSEAWRFYLTHCDHARLEESADLAFWDTFAPCYDQRTALPGTTELTLAELLSLTRAGDRVLDVGAGTGRFALPLARHGRLVTALDHSPAMLSELENNVRVSCLLGGIRTVHSRVEIADVEVHDVVLAAWSLYRQIDLASTLARLAALTGRTLIIVVSDGEGPPHRSTFREIWGNDGEPELPVQIYVLGVLHSLGLHADLKTLHERYEYRFVDLNEAARYFAPSDATDGELERFALSLSNDVRHEGTSLVYSYSVPVSMIVWHNRSK